MKKNMSTTDKIVRLTAAAVMLILYFTNVVSGTLGLVALGVSVIFVITSVVSFCPLYTVFGISTCKVSK